MKNTLTLLAILTLFSQCQAQNFKNMIPTINNKTETFNIKEFEEKAVNNSYVETFDDEMLRAFKNNQGYSVWIYSDNSYFEILKGFYPNGKIEVKETSFIKGTPIGARYFYDKNGKLIKTENTDEGYDFGPEKVVEFCKKNRIALTKGYVSSGGYYTSIGKGTLNGKKTWEIDYLLESGDKVKFITLDGQTGKILKEEIVDYINN